MFSIENCTVDQKKMSTTKAGPTFGYKLPSSFGADGGIADKSGIPGDPKRKKMWIIIGSVVGVIVVATVVTLSIVLTRHRSGKHDHPIVPVGPKGGHKYKCVYDKEQDAHECIADDTNGTCSTNTCCRFDCDGTQCQPSCDGTYSNIDSCHSACGGTTDQYYKCPGCVPTNEVTEYKSPCCGDCNNKCGSATNLTLLNKGTLSMTKFSGSAFASKLAGSRVTDREVKQNFVIHVMGAENTTGVYRVEWDPNSKVLESPTRAVISWSTGSSILSVSLGDQGTLATTGASRSGQSYAQGLVSNDNKWNKPGFDASMGFETTWVLAHPYNNVGFYVERVGAGEALFLSTLTPSTIGAPKVNSFLPTVGAGGTAGTATFLLTVFAGSPTTNQLGYVVLDTIPKNLAFISNPFVTQTPPAIPKDATNFGRAVACTPDSKYLYVGADQYLCVYELSNPTATAVAWQWHSIGQYKMGAAVTSVAVSADNKVVAYTLMNKAQIYVNTSDALAFSVPGQDVAGAGGLSVVQVNTSQYAIVGTGTQEVLWGVVELKE